MRVLLSATLLPLVLTSVAWGAEFQTCLAAKLKVASNYSACRLKVAAKAAKRGAAPDYLRCDSRFALSWAAIESRSTSALCPTHGDSAIIAGALADAADHTVVRLSGTRFVDQGDGTVIDTETGLQWEQKTADGTVHDHDNGYSWTADGSRAPTGTLFTIFLATLNANTSDGNTASHCCFAGHCDWRPPTLDEIRAIISPECFFDTGCLDPVFGPADNLCWTSTGSTDTDDRWVWDMDFSTGAAFDDPKHDEGSAIAVRRAW